MATWGELLERNQKYADTKHKPQPYVSEFSEPLPQFFIFSCIDFRVSVEELLGIRSEDAFIVRNAGGRIKPNFTDLVFVETFTGGQAVKDVIVIHHTDCGYTHNTDEGLKDKLKAQHPNHSHEIDQLHFGTFGSSDWLEMSVREDLKFLNSLPLIRQEIKDNAKGYIYDIKTGKLSPVSHEG